MWFRMKSPRSLWRTGRLLCCMALLVTASWRAQAQRPSAPEQATEPGRSLVLQCRFEGTVDAGSAAYLESCVKRAEEQSATALLITMDTPGGSLEATRDITRAFLASRIPVLIWIGPSGARAGSAGVFLTLASSLAAMAPATNIGAAHPVVGPAGQDPEAAGGEEMARKIENDTVAYAEALARERGRNVEWAAKAVKESASVDAERAVELKVVELIATSPEQFLELADGRTVKTGEGEQVLSLQNPIVTPLEPSLRQRLVHWLAHPSVAYLLFLLGGLGIAIEFANPGLIVPGLVGVVCFVLAMVAFSTLPIQAGAIVLLVIGAGLVGSEFFVGNGMLGLTGVLLLAIGGVLLVDRVDTDWFVEPSFAISWWVVLPTAALAGGTMVYVAIRAAEARKAPQRTGDVGMIGELGRTLSETHPGGGDVFIHGERWQALSPKPIPALRPVRVVRVEGLTLWVEEVT